MWNPYLPFSFLANCLTHSFTMKVWKSSFFQLDRFLLFLPSLKPTVRPWKRRFLLETPIFSVSFREGRFLPRWKACKQLSLGGIWICLHSEETYRKNWNNQHLKSHQENQTDQPAELGRQVAPKSAHNLFGTKKTALLLMLETQEVTWFASHFKPGKPSTWSWVLGPGK